MILQPEIPSVCQNRWLPTDRVYCAKFLLSARSEMFARMFGIGMRESKEISISLGEVTWEVLHEVIR